MNTTMTEIAAPPLRKHYSIFLSRESALWYCEAASIKEFSLAEVEMWDGTTKWRLEHTEDKV